MEINEIELACNLATKSTIDELVIEDYNRGKTEYITEEDLFTEDESGTQIWKEYPQEVFNRWYDYHLSEIEKCKV